MTRTATIERKTKETDIHVALTLDGTGESEVSTGIGFFDHMLEGFARHGFFDLSCHVVGDKKGIRRYGYFVLPMDDALALCAVDFCGRPYLNFDASFPTERVGGLDTELVREFFYAVSYSAGMNLHLKVMDGTNAHHMIEAMFKAFAKALDGATGMEPRVSDVLSTKGTLS